MLDMGEAYGTSGSSGSSDQQLHSCYSVACCMGWAGGAGGVYSHLVRSSVNLAVDHRSNGSTMADW